MHMHAQVRLPDVSDPVIRVCFICLRSRLALLALLAEHFDTVAPEQGCNQLTALRVADPDEVVVEDLEGHLLLSLEVRAASSESLARVRAG